MQVDTGVIGSPRACRTCPPSCGDRVRGGKQGGGGRGRHRGRKILTLGDPEVSNLGPSNGLDEVCERSTKIARIE